MRAVYGDYTHQNQECRIVVASEMLRSPLGVAYGIKRQVGITGAIHGDTQSELHTNIAALMAAYAGDGEDFQFQWNDDTATPDINIVNANTFGGVRVVQPPSFDRGESGEYSSFRYYSIKLEASEPLAGVAGVAFIWEIEEEVEVTTPLPFVHVPILNGPWQKQQNRSHALYTATQTGSITTLWSDPAGLIPPPGWPSDLKEANVGRSSVIVVADGLYARRARYSFQFERNTEFILPPVIV